MSLNWHYASESLSLPFCRFVVSVSAELESVSRLQHRLDIFFCTNNLWYVQSSWPRAFDTFFFLLSLPRSTWSVFVRDLQSIQSRRLYHTLKNLFSIKFVPLFFPFPTSPVSVEWTSYLSEKNVLYREDCGMGSALVSFVESKIISD